MLTRTVMIPVIVKSEIHTLVVKVLYLNKFPCCCWSCKRKVSTKFCELRFLSDSKATFKN